MSEQPGFGPGGSVDAVLQSEPVRAALSELDDMGALTRLHDRDTSLFGDGEVRDVVANRLGWLDVAEAGDRVGRLRAFVDRVRADGFDRVVLAGMGGSSLAPEVFSRVCGTGPDGLPLVVLDSTHPVAVREALGGDLTRTLVLVSSKSGSTEETRDFALYAAPLLPSPAALVAITDPDSDLDRQATAEGWRDVFRNPADIGGRYSALSWFGMVPAALLGVDPAVVWARAEEVLDQSGPGADLAAEAGRQDGTEPAAVLGAFIGGHARTGRDKLTLLMAPGLEAFGDWAEQLVAESLGKRGTGVVPVVGEPAGDPGWDPAVYGEDRAFVELRLGGVRGPGAAALEAAGQPVYTLDFTDRSDIGGQFLLWETAVALAGVLLGVNPFDEPNVSESKANTGEVLAGVRGGKDLPSPEDGDLAALLASVQPGDYVSLQAYLAPGPAVHDALAHLQGLIRDRLHVAVTAGVGPRFLHSTGQLHKGGPGTIVAVQVVDADLWTPDPAPEAEPVPIPGLAYDFGTLVRAQAVGDLASLRDHDRRVVQVGVPGAAGLEDLVDRIRTALPDAPP